MTVYRILADVLVVVHAAYASFVVVGLVLIFAGWLRGWGWVRNLWFRLVHVTMILVVMAEAWLGFVCPLTTWEKALRTLAGQETYAGGFIAWWVHELLFFEFPPWVFTAIYTLFGLAIVAAFVLVPPRRRSRPPVAGR